MRFLVLMLLTSLLANQAHAGICKWKDDEGVVHYAEECPEGVESLPVEIQAGPSSDQVKSAEQRSKELQDVRASRRNEALLEKEAELEKRRKAEEFEAWKKEEGIFELKTWDQIHCEEWLEDKTPAQLRQECEAQRDAQLAPERDKLIAACIAGGDRDPGWCERYWSSYGEATRYGRSIQPRKFDWLPVCVAAQKCGG